ncbi:hypothetical protein CAPTEDRAFT_200995 [Capitella teleta]|uniref:EGF-like domain-containing protein n=1 Tax=Capitella teleta TaxID=283909 RepID=R7UBX9_CAPTE|nr:hypothetical protein CAPTEDRAFT_200995 [Capitella teleta]|eukprot:ELU03474.1 hypothetical protein CAPTEDRAFT_200995 [Capitella teleta]
MATNVIAETDTIMVVCPTGRYKGEGDPVINGEPNCENECHCKALPCLFTNGTCKDGCAIGWRGITCNERDCGVENGGCHHQCTEDKREEWCSCDEGFDISPNDSRECIDINECEGERGVDYDEDCHICVNTIGSYTCGCDDGYELDSATNQTCIALNEANKSNANEVANMVILKLGTRVKHLEEELKSTKKELKEEQYSRRTSIRITDLPENNDENVSDLVNDLFKTMNRNPVINRVHRVGPKDQNKNRSRQCQFTTYPDKYQVMLREKAIRGSHPSVLISEDLTRTRSRIAYLAREKKRQKMCGPRTAGCV